MRFRSVLAGFLAAFAVGGVAVPVANAAKPNAVDRAFAREMIPHHEMAVEMAGMAATDAEHAALKSAAQKIVDDQTGEIRTLKRIARRLGVSPATMDDHNQMMRDAETLDLTMDQMGMSMDMDELKQADPFDREFIDMMITHHQGAIRMAYAERDRGTDGHLRRIARAIVIAQSDEIRELNRWRKRWYGATSPSGGVPKPQD
jgi:uncharacterized protein (DUF305 family)